MHSARFPSTRRPFHARYVLGAVGLACATITPSPALASDEEIELSDPIEVATSFATTKESTTLEPESTGPLALASGNDGVVVAWASADKKVRAARLSFGGEVVENDIDLKTRLELTHRIQLGHGDGKYLFALDGFSSALEGIDGRFFYGVELILTDEKLAVLGTSLVESAAGPCEIAAPPAFDGKEFLLPCGGTVVRIDAGDAQVVKQLPLGNPLRDAFSKNLVCDDAGCELIGLATGGYLWADGFPSRGSAKQIGFADANFSLLAAIGAQDGRLVVARCSISPCGDETGSAKPNFSGVFYPHGGDAKPLPKPLAFGEGVRMPVLRGNGKSIALAWRDTAGGPSLLGLSRTGDVVQPVARLSASRASNVSLTAAPNGKYWVAYDTGASLFVRSAVLDPVSEAPATDHNGGADSAGSGGASTTTPSQQSSSTGNATSGCGCHTAGRQATSSVSRQELGGIAIAALAWLRKRRRASR